MKQKRYKYIGKDHPSHTGKEVELIGELASGDLYVKIIGEGVMIEGGGTWGIELFCKPEDLEEMSE